MVLMEGDMDAVQYTKYIEETFLGSPYVDKFIVKDVHANKQLWDFSRAHGTTDVIVYPDIAFLRNILFPKLISKHLEIESLSIS